LYTAPLRYAVHKIGHLDRSANNGKDMSSILDIDLDYFNLLENPVDRLAEMLKWANCPIAFVEKHHHKALGRWKNYVDRGRLSWTEYILHVDEHHDMMDEKSTPNIANVMFHAMTLWPSCRVHWLVDQAIDSPSMWLSDDTCDLLSDRFSCSFSIPSDWPKPQFVSVCTSPEFVRVECYAQLTKFLNRNLNAEQGSRPNLKSAALLSDRS
jgi:hypothetical protein